MRLYFSLGYFFLIIAIFQFEIVDAQVFARADGNWDSDIWSTTANGAIVPSLRPNSVNSAYTNGQKITVASNVTCRDLFVSNDVDSSITINSDRYVRLRGFLSGYQTGTTNLVAPITNVIIFQNSTSRLRYEPAIASGSYIIDEWSTVSPIGTIELYLGSSRIYRVKSPIEFTGQLRTRSGELIFEDTIKGGGSSQLTIDANSKMTFNNVLTGVNLYSFASGSIAEFDGANQNIPSATYGNLILSGTGTKTVSGTGNLFFEGDLTINSGVTFNSDNASSVSFSGIEASLINNGSWTASDQVFFDGNLNQSISGSGVTAFNGGLAVSKTGGFLDLFTNITINNGIIFDQGTVNANNADITLQSGDWVNNNATFNPGTGRCVFTNTTNITSPSNLINFHNVFLGPGAVVTYNSSFSINGNVTDAGVFNAGSVTFNGTGQTWSIGTLNATNVTIADGSDLTNSGTFNITGALDLGNSGVLTNNNNVVLISSGVSTSARLAELGAGAFYNGDITFQRFVNGPQAWRYFAVPLTNVFLDQWLDDFPITGSFSDASPSGIDNVICQTCPSVFTYNPVTPGYAAVSGASTGATPLSNTIGYSVYSYLDNDFVWDMTGTPATGQIDVPISGATFNLIPNPYPSPIDWDNVDQTGTSGTIYMTAPNTSDFVTYNGTGCLKCTELGYVNWSGEIASGQSFWVDAIGSSNISFQEDDKVSTGTLLKQGTNNNSIAKYFRLTLEKGFLMQENVKRDELLIAFAPTATDSKDLYLDARKLDNPNNLNISSFNSDPAENYAINTLSMLSSQESKSVNLRLADVNPGKYGLKFNDFDKFGLDYKITLIDNYTGKTKVIPTTGETYYAFDIDQNSASWDQNRFDILITSKNDDSEYEPLFAEIYPNPTTGQLNVKLDESILSSIERIILSDFEGNRYFDSFEAEFNEIVSINTSNLRNGIYVLKVLTANSEQNFKVYKH